MLSNWYSIFFLFQFTHFPASPEPSPISPLRHLPRYRSAGSALQWYQKTRANQATSLDQISVEALPGDETELAARLNRDTGAEIIIVDVQGSANQVLAVAAAYADLVAMPVQGGLQDATHALKVVDFVKAIAGRRPMPPIVSYSAAPTYFALETGLYFRSVGPE